MSVTEIMLLCQSPPWLIVELRTVHAEWLNGHLRTSNGWEQSGSVVAYIRPSAVICMCCLVTGIGKGAGGCWVRPAVAGVYNWISGAVIVHHSGVIGTACL